MTTDARARDSAPHNRWLLLALQLPTSPSNARVKTWRRLQQIGAVSVKNSVYVLPNSPQALEDFEWLRTEIVSMKGQATIFTASSCDGADDEAIVVQFRDARADDYKRLLAELGALEKRTRKGSNGRDDLARAARQARERFEHVRAIDFFGAAGMSAVDEALSAIERRARPVPAKGPEQSIPRADRRDYQGRTWITRPRPGVDRFASAWLISRFIDPAAAFVFASDDGNHADAVPFDMYDAGFRHEGDACTFEVLVQAFHVDDGAVRRIAEIVHDLDLKDDRYRPSQAPAIGLLVDGLRASIANDHDLLRAGVVLFESLYRGLAAPGPDGRRSARRTKSDRTS